MCSGLAANDLQAAYRSNITREVIAMLEKQDYQETARLMKALAERQ